MTDLTIEVVSFGYQFALQCTGGVLFAFSSGFTFVEPAGESHVIDPEAIRDESAAALVGLVHEVVIAWTVDHDRTTLELRFSNGASINASADPSYEAWQVHTETGESIVALPGGSTAVFPPHD